MSNPIKLAPRMDQDGNIQVEFDSLTQESVTRYAAAILDEDFLGAGHLAGFPTSATAGYPWVAKLVGVSAPTVGIVANLGGGIAQVTLNAAAEAQEAVLYAGDQLNWDMTKYASFESRLALQVLPPSGVEGVWGYHSAYVAGPDNTARYIDFQVNASGVVNVRIKDGVSSAQSFTAAVPAFATNLPSGLVAGQQVTLVAGAFHNFRIDISNPLNVLFFIDGVRVSPTPPLAAMTFAATGVNAILQPYFDLYASTSGNNASMYIDSVQLSMNRA